MTTIIKKNAKPSEVKKLLVAIKRKPRKPFNPTLYSGILKFDKDPLEIQKEWRREWDRIPSWHKCHSISSKGDKDIPNLLKDKDLYISFISEMELLSFPKLNTEEKIKIKSLLNDLFILEFNSEIKETAIDLRSKYNTSLPDSIILASSLFLNLPVMSADKDFKKIKEINFIMLER